MVISSYYFRKTGGFATKWGMIFAQKTKNWGWCGEWDRNKLEMGGKFY